jgi:ubiquinone biosynthesis protein
MLLREFSKTILEELDFLNEGRNAEKLDLLNKSKNVLIPKIYWDFSRSTVLTLEYFQGTPLSQLLGSSKSAYEALACNPTQIAKRLSGALLKQILQDGCFHGDPHPGNVLILPGGKIALIDFGIIGFQTSSMRNQLAALFMALIQGNDQEIIKILSQMGVVPEEMDRVSFAKDITVLREKLKGGSGKIVMGESIQDSFNIVLRYGIYIPTEFVLVGKSLITLEGVLNKLDPTFSLVEHAKPFAGNCYGKGSALKG